MVLRQLFAPRPAAIAGRALYAAAAAQARNPVFYRSLGVRDTPEGRFELFNLHVALILLRLKGEGEAAAETSQHLFEAYIRSLDDALREMGVGDVVVGKRMRRLGEAFYGRMHSYEQALALRPDLAQLEALIARTALEGSNAGRPAALADYAVRAADHLGSFGLGDLLAGAVEWPEAI